MSPRAPRRFERAPWWFTVLIVILLVPLFSFPALLQHCPAGSTLFQGFLWMYPIVIIASAYYCFISYYDRRALAWIMLVWMALIDASMLYLYLFDNIALLL